MDFEGYPAVTHAQVNTGIKHANIKHVCASVYTIRFSGKKDTWKIAEGDVYWRERGSKMKACLTIFTDVPFSPAGGCLLLLFLTQHHSEEGQPQPVDRERTYTHSEQIDTISIQLWLGHKSPWLITRAQSNCEWSVTQVFAKAEDVLR